MKQGLWKSLLVWLLGLVLFLATPNPGLADGGGEGEKLEQFVDGYQIQMVLDQPARVGETAAQVKLSDSQGQPVTAVVVQITVQLSATIDDHAEAAPDEHDSGHSDSPDIGHNDSPESSHNDNDSHTIEAGAPDDSAEHSHGLSFDLHSTESVGEYTGTLAFEEPGQWTATVLFLVDGKIHQAHFSIEVVQIDSTPTILIGFLVVNAAVITSAIVLKRKSAGPKVA